MSAPDARIRVMFALQLPQLVASVTAPRPGAQCARATHGFEKKKDLARTFSEDWEAVLNLAGDDHDDAGRVRQGVRRCPGRGVRRRRPDCWR